MISDVLFQTWGHLSAHPALKYMYMFCVGSIGAALEVVGRSTVVTVGLVRGGAQGDNQGSNCPSRTLPRDGRRELEKGGIQSKKEITGKHFRNAVKEDRLKKIIRMTFTTDI